MIGELFITRGRAKMGDNLLQIVQRGGEGVEGGGRVTYTPINIIMENNTSQRKSCNNTCAEYCNIRTKFRKTVSSRSGLVHSFFAVGYLGGQSFLCVHSWGSLGGREEGDIHPYLPKVESCRDEKRFCCTKNDCCWALQEARRVMAVGGKVARWQ